MSTKILIISIAVLVVVGIALFYFIHTRKQPTDMLMSGHLVRSHNHIYVTNIMHVDIAYTNVIDTLIFQQGINQKEISTSF